MSVCVTASGSVFGVCYNRVVVCVCVCWVSFFITLVWRCFQTFGSSLNSVFKYVPNREQPKKKKFSVLSLLVVFLFRLVLLFVPSPCYFFV